MNPGRCARQRIRRFIARSPVAEDPRHAENTLAWLLKLEPRADEALQLAALAHDIERARPDRLRREDYADYDRFKADHAARGALMLAEILRRCRVDPELAAESCRLVKLHETGGDPRSDLLRDADSLSFFDLNLPLYHQREGDEETLRRCSWGVRRLSRRGRELLSGMDHPPHLRRIVLKALG